MAEPFTLTDFIRESNRIEEIVREPTMPEFAASERFLRFEEITVAHLVELVSVYQPDARLRVQPSLNVRVGDHVAPQGGSEIEKMLVRILWKASDGSWSAYETHRTYETLHPFTDGNGRSGRMLWLWQMGGIEEAPLGFLHHFYCQALEGE